MKIIVLTSRFPYPVEKGDKLRIYHQIKELSFNNEIILCAIAEDKVSDADFKQLAQFCSKIHVFKLSKWEVFQNLVASIFRKLPFQIGYFFRNSIKQQLQAVFKEEQPDHIYCQLIRTSEYVRDLKIPKTIDYMDAFSIGFTRLAARSGFISKILLKREAKMLANYERQVFDDFTNHTIISSQDRDLLDIPDKASIFVIPNGVDFDYFKPTKAVLTKKYDLVFVGNMGYKPNVEAVKFLSKEILPLVQEQLPTIQTLVAGARPTPEIQRLSDNYLHVSGWLEDIREAYASANIFVAPLFLGAGLQNKILEAMSMGMPCITSSLVNNAIKAQPNKEILIADDAESFAKTIVDLYRNPEKAAEIGRNGQEFVKHNFSWKNFVNQLENIIKYHGK